MSFFSLSPADITELQKRDSGSANLALQLLDRPKQLLAAILLINNFMNFAVIISGAYISSLVFSAGFLDPEFKLMLDVLIITFVILIFGEVIPKYYATQFNQGVLLFMAAPIYYFSKVPPFSWMISGLVRGTEFLRKKKPDNELLTSTELSHALELTMEENPDHQDQRLLHGIVRFGNKEVKQILKPRTEVFALNESLRFSEVLESIQRNGFSRIPVFKENFDKISGVIFAKDLLPHLDKENFDWKSVMRPAYFVSENKKIDDLLRSFQERRFHLAIVVDEYGGTSGIVTLDDVLEEIVGEIADEFDDEELAYSRLDSNTFVFEGRILLKDLYKVLETDGAEFEIRKGRAETLGGFVTNLAGKLPELKQRFRFGRFELEIESVDERAVRRIKLRKDENIEL